MKQLIALMGVLPIMMVFMLQLGLDQKNSQITSNIQSCVYAAKEQAKQEGLFTKEIEEKLKENISKTTGIGADEISIATDKVIKSRYSDFNDRLIHYRVEVKIPKVMACNNIYGVSNRQNSYDFVVEGYTASERI